MRVLVFVVAFGLLWAMGVTSLSVLVLVVGVFSVLGLVFGPIVGVILARTPEQRAYVFRVAGFSVMGLGLVGLYALFR